MDADFWAERWEKKEIGFHRKQVHPLLIEHWPTLAVPPQGEVFVPLCGKSLDMAWLAEQGHTVSGIELSAIALEEFFAGQQLTAESSPDAGLTCWQAGPYRLWQGDLFALRPEQLQGVAAVYDRAALVALPPAMRPEYARKLAGLLPFAAPLLLISYDYPQHERPGPPFSVPLAEIEELFGERFSIERLADHDALEEHPGLQSQGVSRLREFVCLLTRR